MKALLITVLILTLVSPAFATNIGPWDLIETEDGVFFAVPEDDVRDFGVILIERNAYRAALQKATDDLEEHVAYGEAARTQIDRQGRQIRTLRWAAPIAFVLGVVVGVTATR